MAQSEVKPTAQNKRLVASTISALPTSDAVIHYFFAGVCLKLAFGSMFSYLLLVSDLTHFVLRLNILLFHGMGQMESSINYWSQGAFSLVTGVIQYSIRNSGSYFHGMVVRCTQLQHKI